MAKGTCTIDGCEAPHYGRGFCSKHYQRTKRRNGPFPIPTTEERFWAKVDRSEPDGCWPWTGNVGPKGYGQISVAGRVVTVHRAAWFLTYGEWPKDELDHACHDPRECPPGDGCPHRRCVNPLHLEDVTPRVNVLRSGGIAAQNAVKTHCPQGHPFSGDNLGLWRGRRYCRICQRAAERRYQLRRKARLSSGDGP